MSYVQNNLLPDETLAYQAHISLWPYAFQSIVLTGLASLAFLLPSSLNTGYWITVILWGLAGAFTFWAGMYLFKVIVLYRTTELAVTSSRIIVKTGIIEILTSELYLSRVEGVEIAQTILGRVFNYGTVYIRGVGTEIAPVKNISNPLVFRKHFFLQADSFMGISSKDHSPHEP